MMIRAAAQNTTDLRFIRLASSYTSFPDTARANGHMYKNTLYDAAAHYKDSSVLVMIPRTFKPGKKVNLLFWFHGWGNNIDSAAVRYQLIRQFAASKLNAVLVLAETTRDAPDSYGGKLEYPGVFKNLVGDVLDRLKKEKIIRAVAESGNILLAGHSGAYRVMAYILKNGNLPVQEVILFDALYSETDKFMNWIRADINHRFIDIYTNGGGTDGETKQMAKIMEDEKISFQNTEESLVNAELIRANRIIIIHSLHEHNDIISNPDNFELFIENSPFLKKPANQ